jgi:hypothetical protein
MAVAPVDHVKRLNEILSQTSEESSTPSEIERVIQIAKETIGVTQANFLPWKNEYGKRAYIDGITPEALGTKSLVWGYDPRNRPFITFQYQFKETGKTPSTEAVTLFQRYTDCRSGVCGGGRMVRIFSVMEDEECFNNLRKLLSGKTLNQEVSLVNKDGSSRRTVTWEFTLLKFCHA